MYCIILNFFSEIKLKFLHSFFTNRSYFFQRYFRIARYAEGTKTKESFAALTGFDAQLRETERQTQAQAEPNEDALQELDQSLHTLFACVHTQPAVQVRWFVPDAKKSGGAYKTAAGRVLQLDRNRSLLVLDSGPVIALGAIAELRFL